MVLASQYLGKGNASVNSSSSAHLSPHPFSIQATTGLTGQLNVLFNDEFKKILQRCWKVMFTGTEHMPSFFVPTLRHLDTLCVPDARGGGRGWTLLRWTDA